MTPDFLAERWANSAGEELLRSLFYFLQPVQVSLDLQSGLAVKMPYIITDVLVVGFPRIKMPKQQVMIPSPDLTQRYQILWVKL